MLIRKICDQKKIGGTNTSYLKVTLGVFSISVVLGLTWVFGAFIVSKETDVFRYLFVIFNTFQGFLFFIFIAIVHTEGRAFWCNFLCRKSSLLRLGDKSEASKSSFITRQVPMSSLTSRTDVFSSIEKKKDCETSKENNNFVNANLPVAFQNQLFEMSSVDPNQQTDLESLNKEFQSEVSQSDPQSNDRHSLQDVAIPMMVDPQSNENHSKDVAISIGSTHSLTVGWSQQDLTQQ